MKNDGGPAFPVVGPDGPYGAGDDVTIGISTRLYVSTKMVQGMLASGQSNITIDGIRMCDIGFDKLAIYMADKLIAECDK